LCDKRNHDIDDLIAVGGVSVGQNAAKKFKFHENKAVLTDRAQRLANVDCLLESSFIP